MKRIINIKICTMVLCLFSALSCQDILDQEPLSITHPGVFWTSQSNAEQALAGSYGLFKNSIMNTAAFYYWGEIPGMTFMDSRNWISNYIEDGGNYVLAYRDNTRDWKSFYRAANWATTIEKYVDEMPVELFDSQSEKDRIIGEAAFVRALSYFYMTRIWGDVPIVKESIESSDQLIGGDGYITKIPRSDEIEVLDFCLEAVNKAIGLLEYSSPASNTWAIRANKASAEALKAHITLWYASRDNDNAEMINQAIEATTAVINNSGAELIDYVVDGEEGFNEMCIGQSKTGLFEINVDSGMNESFIVGSNDAHYTGFTLNYPSIKDKDNGATSFFNPDFYGNEMIRNDSDRDNDARKNLFFYDYENHLNTYLLKYSQTSDDPNSNDAYTVFSESNILIFRLADMYLLRAEANARLGKSGAAITDLNEIRSKANVPNYSGATDRAALMKAIFDERAIEFVGEAQSAYDRIRMDLYYEGVGWMNQSRLSKEGYFWPVHPDIISINPAIVQTEYWKGAL